MPTLNFVLPLWAYWTGLAVFPFVAMYLVARQRRRGAPREAALAIALLLLVDAFLIPGLARRRRAQESPLAAAEAHAPVVHEPGTAEDPTLGFHSRVTDAIEWVNVKAGEYVAYWAVISV